MLDPKVIEQLVKEQIATLVTEQVLEIFSTNDWLVPIEQKIVTYTQKRVLAKFAQAEAMPEIIDAVKQGITELFASGNIPSIDQYINQDSIIQAVDFAVEKTIQDNVLKLAQDPAWLKRVENLVNQGVVHQTIRTISQLDINSVIKGRVDETMELFKSKIGEQFRSTGITDMASGVQLTIMDDTTVVENQLTARNLQVVDNATIQNLVVKGSINTDNLSWNALAEHVSNKTLEKLSEDWRQTLVKQVTEEIQFQGIKFDRVKINDDLLVDGSRLSRHITETSIQQVGTLGTLTVRGESHLNNSLSALNKRVGINTTEPESALSVWDEEVSLVFGKHKLNEAYIGTNRPQAVTIGVNRQAQIEIDIEGLTKVKKLQVASWKISHSTQVPGWSGTRGDIVFNTNPGADGVFGWLCVGGFKWQVLKSAA